MLRLLLIGVFLTCYIKAESIQIYSADPNRNRNTTQIIGLALIAGCSDASYNYDIHSPWKFDTVKPIEGTGAYSHIGTSALGCYKDDSTGKLYYRVLNLEKTIKLQNVLAQWISDSGPTININQSFAYPCSFYVKQ